MSTVIYSSNMNLPIPVQGQQTGPNYAINIDNCLSLIDSHDHSSGKGVQITPAGLNINADFPMNNNNLTTVKSIRFQAQSSLPATSPNLLCFYTVGNDVYFNDGAGNVVRITQSGSVAGASGTITGLPSGTASAAYSAVSSKFIFQSASNTAADIDMGSAIIRERAAGAKAIMISSPLSLANDYQVFMPAALPASQKFLSLDASGNIASNWAVDGSTLEVSSNNVQVKDLGISTAKLANNSVTQAKRAALGQQVSSSCGNFTATGTTPTDVTNLSVSITTTGRPIYIGIQADGTTNTANFQATINTGVSAIGNVNILRATTVIAGSQIGVGFAGANQVSSVTVPASISFIDIQSAGTYIYKVQAFAGSTGAQMKVNNAVLIAYEL